MSIREQLKKFKFLKKIVYRFRVIKGVNWYKSVILNFKTQQISKAIHFPILVYGKLKISKLTGKWILNGPIEFGRVRIGYNSDQFSASKGSAMLNLTGKIICEGTFWCSVDVLLQVSGKLELADGVFFGNSAKLRCNKYIYFGIGSRMVSECQAFDTNFHFTRDIHTGKIQKPDGEIIIGNFCWIGNRCTLSKGTKLPDYTMVASNSLCNKDFTDCEIVAPLIGGIPAKTIGTGGIVRVFDIREEEFYHNYFLQHPEAVTYISNSGLKDETESIKYSFKNLVAL